MEMIVTSESTALSVIRIEPRTGTPTRRKLFGESEGSETRWPSIRPTTTNTSTGMTIIPNAPSGSRKKTLISIQVSVQSPRNMAALLIADRVASELEKDVFEVGQHRPEIGNLDAVFRHAVNHIGHEVVPRPANRQAGIYARDRLKSWHRSKPFFGSWVVCREHHGALRAVPLH